MIEIEGFIFEILPIQTFKGDFSKREIIIAIEGGQYISFEAVGKTLTAIEKFKIGDSVHLSFVLKGKLWMSPKGEKKYYNTLEIRDIQYSIKS